MLPSRTIGRRGPAVSALGLGTMGMSDGYYGPSDDSSSVATIRHAVDLGVSLIDTADVYGAAGHNEMLVGRALEGIRDRVTLATKTGLVRSPDGLVVDGRPERIRRAAEESLRRLRTDRIDLYYLHRIDPRVPVEESVGAMAGLVAEGIARHVGLSEVGPATLRRAHAVHPSRRSSRSTRSGTANPRRSSCPCCASWASGSLPSAPSAGASSPARSTVARIWVTTTCAGAFRGSRARTSPATCASPPGWPRWRGATAPPRPRWRWRGCSAAGTT